MSEKALLLTLIVVALLTSLTALAAVVVFHYETITCALQRTELCVHWEGRR